MVPSPLEGCSGVVPGRRCSLIFCSRLVSLPLRHWKCTCLRDSCQRPCGVRQCRTDAGSWIESLPDSGAMLCDHNNKQKQDCKARGSHGITTPPNSRNTRPTYKAAWIQWYASLPVGPKGPADRLIITQSHKMHYRGPGVGLVAATFVLVTADSVWTTLWKAFDGAVFSCSVSLGYFILRGPTVTVLRLFFGTPWSAIVSLEANCHLFFGSLGHQLRSVGTKESPKLWSNYLYYHLGGLDSPSWFTLGVWTTGGWVCNVSCNRGVAM